MKYTNGKRGLLQAVALAQVLLLAAAGCKSTVNNGVNPVAVTQALDLTVTASGTVVNGYAALAGDATAGANAVIVNTLLPPDSGAYSGLQNLAPGDLVLIIQMAGASIDPNDTVNYGTVTDLKNAGKYELNTVASTTPGTNTIGLACALRNSYSAAGKAQVIRVPQYGNLTINNGASITAPAWDGTVGGVVAVQAAQLNVAGAINVSEMGFHGGAVHVGGASAATDLTIYRSNVATDGAEKGEGIAGWPNHDSAAAFPYPYGRGAPANAGGGGDWHNAGGGGGANAAASGTWTGEGVMLSTAAGVVGGTLAWPLDPSYPGSLASSLSGGSPGGGRGGYTYSNGALDPTTAGGAPGLAGWNGNRRRERGGLGGHVLTSSPAGRLFMGGGGGAGDENNGNAVQGGRGGGLAFVIAGTVSGSGKIQANGAAGGAATSATGASGDAPGGGGGGGTVVIHATTTLSGISVEANGGLGGGQTVSNGNEAEGPGGGGGGGYIAVSGGTPAAASASGGLGGTTNAVAMTNFPSNGATAGHNGVTTGDATTILVCTIPADAGVDAQAEEAGSETGAQDATPDVQAIDSPVVLQDASAPDASPGLDSADGPGTVVFLDAGGDTSPGLDSVDAIAISADAPAIIVDAPATLVDAPVTVVPLDAAAVVDLAPIGGQDAPPIGNLDAAKDATTADAEGLLDAIIRDSGGDAGPRDAQVVVPLDASSIEVSVGSDQAVLPPDAQAVADAPVSVGPGPDAPGTPVNNNTFAVMGSGFCAVNPMRGSAPGLFTFFLLAGFGLGLRRRRR